MPLMAVGGKWFHGWHEELIVMLEGPEHHLEVSLEAQVEGVFEGFASPFCFLRAVSVAKVFYCGLVRYRKKPCPHKEEGDGNGQRHADHKAERHRLRLVPQLHLARVVVAEQAKPVQSNAHHSVRRGQPEVYQKQQKIAVVKMPHTLTHPWTEVVHLQYKVAAHMAVVCTRRLWLSAVVAPQGEPFTTSADNRLLLICLMQFVL